MARNSAYNSLARRTLRRARRLKFDFGRGVISVPNYRVRIPTDREGEFKVKRYDTEDELLDDLENIPKGSWIETVYEHGGYETII